MLQDNVDSVGIFSNNATGLASAKAATNAMIAKIRETDPRAIIRVHFTLGSSTFQVWVSTHLR